jgi:hypothetical protein
MMIWLLTISLAAGGLLAQHFKIIMLAPATFVIVVMAIAVGGAQTTDIWSIVLTMTVASAGIQTGYFLGMLIHIGLTGSSPSSGTARPASSGTARRASIFRTLISR